MIGAGDTAPQFELSDQDGGQVALSDLRGQTVVLYFYPKADTPGCTKQACGVRDHAARYVSAEAVVIGVSPDPVAKVKKFHDKHDLGFTLLADSDHAVCEAYGVWQEKQMYGRRYMGVVRSTFVIGAVGTVESVLENVRAAAHDDLVLEALAQA